MKIRSGDALNSHVTFVTRDMNAFAKLFAFFVRNLLISDYDQELFF